MFGSVMMSNMQENDIRTDGIGIIEQTPTGIASILHTPEDNCIVILPGGERRDSGWSLEQFLTFAVKAASLSVTKYGAQAGMLGIGVVERF